jgi:hypothetical protein
MNIEEAKAEAVRIARKILVGEINLVSGCRAIQRPLADLGLRMDEEFITFAGVDSEADELPIGDERQHWNPEALQKLEPKVQEFMAYYRPHVEQACRMLIARFA